MAILKHIASKNANYGSAIDYLKYQHDEFHLVPVLDENGNMMLRDEFYLEGLNCDPETFDLECELLNQEYNKNNTYDEIKSHHYIISHDPKDNTDHNLTGEWAQAIGMEYAKANFPGHQALVCTHTDGKNGTGNIHTHIIINSLRKSDVDPQPFTERPIDCKAGYKHHLTKDYLKHLQKSLMNICQREGLHQVDLLSPAPDRISPQEYYAKQRGQQNLDIANMELMIEGITPMHTTFETGKEKIRNAISDIAERATSFEEFQRLLKAEYGISVKDHRGRFSYLPVDRQKYISARALGSNYDRDRLLHIFAENARSKERNNPHWAADDPLAILFINGMCLGAGILVSTAFGAGDTELVERQVSTTAIAGTAFSLAFSLLCILLANPLLRLLQVPAEILPIAVNYLRIVFAGLLFTFFYNFLAATLRALGDSKSALYFLMISAVLNIGGDLFFVEALDWGSEGCALSTVLSEGMCCLLCALYIRWKVPVLQLGRRWFVFDGKLLRKTVSYGWVSAMQQATVQLGKIAVQAIVNTMGVSAMAAFTAASRIDDFAYTPQQNIAHAMTTFMAQNEGAGKKDRVKDGYRCGMRIEVVYALGLMAVCLIFAEPIIRLFVTDPEVVDLGVRFLRTISLFYLMPAATNGIQGFFRGIGDLRITLISSILNMAGRVAAASVLVLLWKMEIEALPYSYAFGWVLMLAYELPAMLRYLRKNKM